MSERPLRILHCFRSPVGGIFRHVRDLAEAHANAGHQVGILCDSTTGGTHEDALFEEVRPHLALGIIRVPIHRSIGASDAAALWRGYKEIRSLQPDVLHGHGAKGGVLARIVGSALRVNKYRVARLYSPHGGSLHFERRSLAGSLILRVERLQERLTDALVFVCEYERRTYGARVGLPLARNELIYNGIDDAEFEPVETGPGAVDFLYIGMMRDLKGPDLFIEGFAAAEEIAGRRLSALMVGDGPQQRQYEEMTLRMGLADRVRLLPAMRAREAFALARKVVIPSRAESMPYILLEALAAGKPVIATRVGGIPEVLGADSEALVPPGDAGALARLMADAIGDAGWAARTMPDAERFKSRFAASVMTRHVMQLYRDLTEESLVPQGRLRTT
ncbi:glycosyltransferase family 4 protein [Sinorhizobium meliloti]|jgi:glycosyltransferase involved in cell wall biosynthesis|uniref:Glycosyltransferase n=2 Tax=Rhizobium meliloti TaxID=382 RepID=Q92QS5_RHIME|nr:glycosyltransferase family 4 protein [Sinorhizobium meliloti]PST27898.1 glycosyltransferase family 1 protein [Mesorhizobium loti]TWA97981.1 glycosyltransferase involved in cell wall biosynthesis [Ensifer sp. SEMIA 134]TWB33527.1 glycosyltransferase involved in cell wall biosynthesis [Ensifer sp. SEMIA 135]AEG03790.1 glycosyl transferase group 1 [Sinorhizobium meliloti BL225C]AEH79617.1 putative glycosyltransferase protein [Sinorhizobium meliloti SM11]